MSTLSAPLPTDPKELRPLPHQKLDDATDEQLTAVHRFLLELEARRLFDLMGKEADEEWTSGRLTQENIAEAIAEHRRKHPYR